MTVAVVATKNGTAVIFQKHRRKRFSEVDEKTEIGQADRQTDSQLHGFSTSVPHVTAVCRICFTSRLTSENAGRRSFFQKKKNNTLNLYSRPALAK